MKYELTDEMKKDRLNCGENADCNECSCQIGTDDCIYNHITTVADYIKKMNNNQLAIYLHSWQTENMSVEEIKDLLNSEHTADDFNKWKRNHNAELLDKVADMILDLPKKYIDNFDYVACALILNGLEEMKAKI